MAHCCVYTMLLSRLVKQDSGLVFGSFTMNEHNCINIMSVSTFDHWIIQQEKLAHSQHILADL